MDLITNHFTVEKTWHDEPIVFVSSHKQVAVLPTWPSYLHMTACCCHQPGPPRSTFEWLLSLPG